MTSRWQIVFDERGLTALKLRKSSGQKLPNGRSASQQSKWRAGAEKELRAYLAGRSKSCAVPYDISALPPFTRAVLQLTTTIPYGEVRSCTWMARRLGKPKAARAVGNALARNPLPMVIPCHRAVRADGTFGPFVLGPAWKKGLLRLEKSP
jgi:methylated-DNA-[protein]-cysteine S-methyltransferase